MPPYDKETGVYTTIEPNVYVEYAGKIIGKLQREEEAEDGEDKDK